MENNKKVFRSRISVLLVGFILAVVIPIAINFYLDKEYQELYRIGGFSVFFFFLFGGIRYIITGEKLYIKMWVIPFGRVKIANITSVKRSYNPLSSFAVSLKRLRIRFVNGWFCLISPVREKDFIEALKAVNPDIAINIPEKKGKWRIWDWDI